MTHPTQSRRVTQLLFYGAVILLASLVYRIVEPFLVQIGWAAVLAICVYPWHARLAHRFGDSRGALLSTLVVTFLLVVPALFVAMAIISEGSHAESDIQEVLERGTAADKVREWWDWARTHLPLPPVEDIKARVTTGLTAVATGAAAKAGGFVKNVAVFLFDLFLTLFILFFLLRDARSFSGAVSRVLPFDDEQRRRLIALTRDLVSASVTASLAIAAVQGLVGGITFALLGIRAPVLWGVVMGFASLIPLVGTGLVWIPAASWLLLSGQTWRGLVLVAMGVVIGNVDNVLRPILLSGRAQMPTLVIFVSLLGGVSAFGFVGIVLGPLVTAVALALLESYVPEEAEAPPPVTEEPTELEPPSI